jgi:hypothetical protein
MSGHRVLGQFLGAAIVAIAGCGHGDSDVVVVDDVPILTELAALPGVTVVELTTYQPGYRRFDLHFTQPVDHDHPDGPTFQQQATLMHRDADAPLVLVSTGYWDYLGDELEEPTILLGANQLVVEHRYFAASRPDPADWSFLTIAQAAADHHAIVEELQGIYAGPWVSTGASKGGMTSIYHRRFYPDDVVGTIPYVAPMSFGAPDTSYDAFYQAIGPADCRQALRDLSAEMLANRRDMLEERATAQAAYDGYSYERIPIGPAVESAVVNLSWSFWQYVGVDSCGSVPLVTASDDDVWAFLDSTSFVASASDDYVAAFEPYYYQAEVELGYPKVTDAELDGLLRYSDADYAGSYPLGVTLPPFQPDAMTDISDWMKTEGRGFVFVYGELDPWTGGRFDLGDAQDAVELTAPNGSHLSQLADLEPADRADAYARIGAWTGVDIDDSAARRAPPARRQPRLIGGRVP